MTDALINGLFKLVGKGRKVGHMISNDPNAQSVINNHINSKGQHYLNNLNNTQDNNDNNKIQNNYKIHPKIMTTIVNNNGIR